MPAKPVYKAKDAALLVTASDGAYSVECTIQTHFLVCIEWVTVCNTTAYDVTTGKGSTGAAATSVVVHLHSPKGLFGIDVGH